VVHASTIAQGPHRAHGFGPTPGHRRLVFLLSGKLAHQVFLLLGQLVYALF
jgi:hypothetical protein